MTSLHLSAAAESWPLAKPFRISRGVKTEAQVVVVTASRDGVVGHAECVPYARYGETVESVLAEVAELAADPRALDRISLQTQMKPGAARTAVDCALWDLEAKAAHSTVSALASLAAPGPVTTAYTLSLDSPDAMALAAREAAAYPLLKLKLGGEGDDARIRAVRAARADARLIVDANEAWTATLLEPLLAAAAEVGVELVEQPLPAGDDQALAAIHRPVVVCADESAHTRAELPALLGKYDALNIKLDKTGGLTEALALAEAARAAGLQIMVGCMVGTSLAMAPAMLLAQAARWVDLDGPLLLAKDRPGGLRADGGTLYPPSPALWG